MFPCTNYSQWSPQMPQTMDPDLFKSLLGLLTVLVAWIRPPPHPMLTTKLKAATIVKDTDNKSQ